MSTVICVENLSKKYIIGHQKQERYTALRDVLTDGAKRFTHKLIHPFAAPSNDPTHEEFWALKDVSFDIQQGDRVGIIGRNGAGKSTLLKILSRITEPTSGKVSIKGRVASLLEVGTGFHPELSGRENIFLNGAILGMSKAEIKSKFDEIVAFAEVEKFLDTPVKRYSSGMYVRLAFAVAAHLEPEILIVDEVLAVGDAQFQKKCLGKMEEAGKEGRTVLFVSHNLSAISQLCSTAILLEQGRVRLTGDVRKIIDLHLSNDVVDRSDVNDISGCTNRHGNMEARFESIDIQDQNKLGRTTFSIGENINICFKVSISEKIIGQTVKLAVQLRTSDGINLCNMTDVDSHFQLSRTSESEVVTVKLSDVRWYPGIYYISLWAGSVDSKETYDAIADCGKFEIIGGGQLTSRHLPRNVGLVFLTPEWQRDNHT